MSLGLQSFCCSCADDRTEVVSAANAHNEKANVMVLNFIGSSAYLW